MAVKPNEPYVITLVLSQYLVRCNARANFYVQLSLTDNTAFNGALQEHLGKLNQNERDIFKKAYQDISPDDLLTKVEEWDNTHNNAAASEDARSRSLDSYGLLNSLCEA
jgi:hypothetical protein